MPVAGLESYAVVTVDEVDLPNRLAHVSDKTGGKFLVSFRSSPAGILYVPAQGENWVAVKIGVQWYLDTKLDDTDDHTWAVQNLNPGDVRIKGTRIFLEGIVEGDVGGAFTVAQVAHGFAIGQVVRYDAATHKFVLAKADSAAHAESIGVVSNIVDVDTFRLTVVGSIAGLSGLTEGATYFLSPTIAGALQATAPTTVGQVSKPLLIAVGTTSGYVFNFRGEVITAPLTAPMGLDGLDAPMNLDAVRKPAGIVAGEVPVWNGTTFVRSSVTGIGTLTTLAAAQTVSAANTDLAWYGGVNNSVLAYVTTTGGTLRTLAAPTTGTGTRTIIRCTNGSITIKHQLAGGTGAMFFIRNAADLVLGANDLAEFIYDGGTWVEVSRDLTNISGSELDFVENQSVAIVTVTATTAATAQSVVTGNSVTYDGATAVMLETGVFDLQPDTTVAGRRIVVALFDNGTVYRIVGWCYAQAAGVSDVVGAYGKWKVTPSAGAHIYSLRSWVSAGSGIVGTGNGGVNDSPAWIRVTRA